MLDRRRAVYFDEELKGWVYSASALGHCPRALLAWRLGYDPVTSLMERLPGDYSAEGNLQELDILDRLLAGRGWVTEGRRQETVEARVHLDRSLIVRGHIDDVVRHKDTDQLAVVDAKSMSENQFRKWARSDEHFETYLWQLSAYMEATGGLPGIIAAKNRNNGDYLARYYSEPPFPFREIVERVAMVERKATAADADVSMLHCDSDFSFACKFPYVHDDYDADGPSGPMSVEDYGLQALARIFTTVKGEADKHTRELQEWREKIMEVLGEKPDVDVKVGQYRIRKQTRKREVKAFSGTSQYLTVEDTNAKRRTAPPQ